MGKGRERSVLFRYGAVDAGGDLSIKVAARHPNARARWAAACRAAHVRCYTAALAGRRAHFFADLGAAHRVAPRLGAPSSVASVALADALRSPPALPARRVPPLYWALRVAHARNGYPASAAELDAALAPAALAALGVPAGALTRDTLAELARHDHIELPAVCAVLGGILAQEIVRGVAADEVPITGFLCFDATTNEAVVV